MKRIYYTGIPKYVQGLIFENDIEYVGDYLGIKNCKFITGIKVFRSKKAMRIRNVPHFDSCGGMFFCMVAEEIFKMRLMRFFKTLLTPAFEVEEFIEN